MGAGAGAGDDELGCGGFQSWAEGPEAASGGDGGDRDSDTGTLISPLS